MKRYGNLFPQITEFSNLLVASHKAMLGHKQKPAEARFFFNLENELFKLQEETPKSFISAAYLSHLLYSRTETASNLRRTDS